MGLFDFVSDRVSPYGADTISLFSFWKKMEKNLSPEEKLIERDFFWQTGFIALLLFFMSISSSYLQDIDDDFWPQADVFFTPSDNFSIATDGFFGKTSVPTLSDVERKDLDVVRYEVQKGDSLFVIASRFGIRTRTILENNDIPNSSVLQTGQVLKILPVDGVLYSVKNGDTLSQIAKKYSVDMDSIIEQNNINPEKGIIAGKEIILPGARKIIEIYTPPPVIVQTPPKKPDVKPVSTPTPVSKPVVQTPPKKTTASSTPSGKFAWPVQGSYQVTQWYRSGHYAIDIWGPNRPNILAAQSGTVEIAAAGCKVGYKRCNRGYGNYIVINHGGGMKTLYSHNTTHYVKQGDKVRKGQVIAKMGNTGNVRGRTGIHLHFEVHLNGRKMNPAKYL